MIVLFHRSCNNALNIPTIIVWFHIPCEKHNYESIMILIAITSSYDPALVCSMRRGTFSPPPLMDLTSGRSPHRGRGGGRGEHRVRLPGLRRTEHYAHWCRPLLLQHGQSLAMTYGNSCHVTRWTWRGAKHSKNTSHRLREWTKMFLYNWTGLKKKKKVKLQDKQGRCEWAVFICTEYR